MVDMFSSMNALPTIPQQTAWSYCPCTLNQEVRTRAHACVLNDYPSILVPTPAIPFYYRTASEDPRYCRKVFLRRCVFRLIEENIYLALTDPKLLGWFLGLSPEDRKIIQDEGGLNPFLRGHPALGLTKHHVYLRKTVPEGARGNLPLWGSSVNSYSQQQDSFYSTYNSPFPQIEHPQASQPSELTLQMANSGSRYVFKNSEPLANFSLDMELEKHIQGENDQISSVKSAVGKEFSTECSGFESGHLNSTEPPSNSNIFLRGSEDETNLSLNEDTFYSIMKEDKSVLMCYPKEGPETNTTGFHSEEVSSEIKALVSSNTEKSVIRTTAEKSTSAMISVCTCDVMVGTEQPFTSSALTQTEESQTADKHVNTEVCMSDLDYLTKEYITIKTERDELLEKVNMQRTKSPSAKIVNDLKILESDYKKKREKILAGISLQDNKPLSLDSEETTTCIQTKKISNVGLGSSQHQDNGPCGQTSPNCENTKGSKDSQKVRDAPKTDPIKIKRTVTHVPKDKDLNASEAWYDAEEDLPSVVSKMQENLTEAKEYIGDNLASDEQKTMSAVLCVSGLPNNVTESDVMLWFEKYLVSEVHISTLKELSVAIVTVGSHQSAEAAARELNGTTIKGRTVQVDRINTGRQEYQDQASTCTSDPEPLSSSSKNNNQSTTSLTSSSTKKKVVCISPTAQETFVPQHYGAMGSFDILMSDLTQRHPNVGRQRIVDALLELRAKYRGVLSGLPLRVIREMTSDLLTRPAACKEAQIC